MLEQNKLEDTVWNIEILRSTLFLNPSEKIDSTNWWADFTGMPPENQVVRAREGIHEYNGNFADGKLRLVNNPIRIDWLYTLPDNSEDRQWIGPWDSTIDQFIKPLYQWLAKSPKVNRFALGVVSLIPVSDRVTGYKVLAKYLPNINLDPEGSSDLSYQINRPRKSIIDIPGLKINRLSKWSVASYGFTSFQVNPVTPTLIQPLLDNFSCRLELDINTPSKYEGEIPVEKYKDVYSELAALAKEISIKGDIP